MLGLVKLSFVIIFDGKFGKLEKTLVDFIVDFCSATGR